MRSSVFSVLWLSCLLGVAGCSAAPTARHTVIATSTTSPTATLATTPTEALAPNSPWHLLWTLPALPPPPPGTYGADPPYLPQIAWSPANAQRLYLCRATLLYAEMPAVLHDLYRSDDQGQHWKAYALPEASASCHIEVDPTNADALVLQDDRSHAYVSRDGGQTWQAIPDPPQWDSSLGEPPDVQIMVGKLYVEGYWTTDLTHWIRWYPAADEQLVYVQINTQNPQTLYTTVNSVTFRCAGMPAALQIAAFETTLCRSNDGGLTWRFLTVVGLPLSGAPEFCLSLNHPDTLYAWGYLEPHDATHPAGAIRSTDSGQTWSHLPDLFTGGSSDTNLPSCGADAYAGQSPVRIDGDYATVENNQWQNFGFTAEGTISHVVDMAGTRQDVPMSPGVSLLTDVGWKVIAPYPGGVTTPDTNYRLRMLLMTPLSGAPVLLAFTDQHVYEYPLSSR